METKIFGDTERYTIEATFTQCFNYQRNSKFTEAHTCYDTTLNFIESKTKNINLNNINMGSNLTDFVALVQYYFSQPSTVTAYKAPTDRLFESQSSRAQAQIFTDMGKNYNTNISSFLKDYLSVKHIFISGDYDFLCYRKSIRDWL